MNQTIPFNKPSLGEAEKQAVMRAIDTGNIGGNGAIGQEVQGRLCEMLQTNYALLTTSCSHALELAVMTLGIGPGDEVIVPSFTFVTTASSVVREGATPVFAEIDEQTMNLDPADVESKITEATRAILPVHYAGMSADMDALSAIAHKHDLYVIEDAAQAFGSTYRGQALGTLGDIGCFSFHFTKNIVGGEGGAFITSDPDIAERAEIKREKGTNRSKFLRGEVDKYSWVDVGSSFVPSDMIAALVLAQLDRIDELFERREQIWKRYHHELQELENNGEIILPFVSPEAGCNWHIFAMRVRDSSRRNAVLRELKERRIGATFHFVPLHSSPYARERWGYEPEDLPITERVAASLIRLPLYCDLTDAEQTYVIEALYDILS